MSDSRVTYQQVQKLAKLKRTRKNLEKIQEFVAELEEHQSAVLQAVEAVQSLYGATNDVETIETALTAAAEYGFFDPANVPVVVEALNAINRALPEETDESSLHGLGDAIQVVKDGAESYEYALDDSGQNAEAREELWEELTAALDALSNCYVLEG